MLQTTAAMDPSAPRDGLRSPLLHPPPEDPQAGDPDCRRERLCIDEMLQEYCGEFGPWQSRHFVLTSLAWALEGFHTMVMIFADNHSGQGGGAGSSTADEWGLTGGEKYKVGLVQAVFFGGCMIGQSSFVPIANVSLRPTGLPLPRSHPYHLPSDWATHILVFITLFD